MSHCEGPFCDGESCECDCQACRPSYGGSFDSIAAGIDQVVRERDELKARVAALEEQIRLGPTTDRLGAPIDPAHYEVYRDAAVLLSTYMTGVRGSVHRTDEDKRHLEQLWGPVVDKIDVCLDEERTVH